MDEKIKRFGIPAMKGKRLVQPDKIAGLTARKQYCDLHLTTGETIKAMSDSMCYHLARLKKLGIVCCKINRSEVVVVELIVYLADDWNIKLEGGKELYVSEEHREELMGLLEVV